MQVLAGAAPATTGFLHAGYTSAGPRPFTYSNPSWQESAQILDTGTPVDVAVALQLEGETLPVTPAAAEVAVPDAVNVGADVFAPSLGLAVAFLLLLAFLYAARVWGTWRRLAYVLAGLLLLLVVTAVTLPSIARYRETMYRPPELPPANAPAPWDGVPPRAYADPPTATLALMHGIVASALANAWWPVEALGQLRNEVGLPLGDLTEGERYALQTYGLDGWGRPFRLQSQPLDSAQRGMTGYEAAQQRAFGKVVVPVQTATRNFNTESLRYVLTSAGPDGAFDTSDDIALKVPGLAEYTWDAYGSAPLLYKHGQRIVWFRHRWPGKTFRYANEEWARRLTGGALFDLMPADDIGNKLVYLKEEGEGNEGLVDIGPKVPELYERMAVGKPRPPLVLVIPAPEAPPSV
jgi:hypothetical protein